MGIECSADGLRFTLGSCFGLTSSPWLNGLRPSAWTLPLSPSKPAWCTSRRDSSPSPANLCSLTWPSTMWLSHPLRTSWSRRPRVASPDTSRASLDSGANQALPWGRGRVWLSVCVVRNPGRSRPALAQGRSTPSSPAFPCLVCLYTSLPPRVLGGRPAVLWWTCAGSCVLLPGGGAPASWSRLSHGQEWSRGVHSRHGWGLACLVVFLHYHGFE